MGQEWILVNVDKKQMLCSNGDLADFIERKSAVGRHLLCCLTDVKWIPVTKIMDRLKINYKNDCELRSLGRFQLPVEIINMIFSEIDDLGDVFSLALSNTRLMITGESRLRQLMTFPDWQGDRIICVGDLTDDTNFPEGLITQECRDFLREVHDDDSDTEDDSDLSQFVTWMECEGSGFQEFELEFLTQQRRALSRNIVRTDKDKTTIYNKFAFKMTTTRRISRNSAILWNLSKKSYCRRDTVLKLLKGRKGWNASDIYAVMGSILHVQICHSTENETGLVHSSLHQGKWAGDQFEFTSENVLESRLKQREDLWEDVSEEVTKKYLDVTEAEREYPSDDYDGFWSDESY